MSLLQRAKERYACSRYHRALDRLPGITESPDRRWPIAKALARLSHCDPRVLVSPDDLLRAEAVPLDAGGGVYAWYFRSLPAIEDTYLAEVGSFQLMYIGLATERSIARRVLDEDLYRTSESRLRQSLGALLKSKLFLHVTPDDRGDYTFDLPSEKTLTSWMAENGRLMWIEDKNPDEIASAASRLIPLPLNIRGRLENTDPAVLQARIECLAAAREGSV